MRLRPGEKSRIQYFEEIKELILDADIDDDLCDDYLAFIERQILALEKRKVAAKRRGEAKKEEVDDLTKNVYRATGNKWRTVDQIVATVLDDGFIKDVTKNKVISRLSKLSEFGYLEKGWARVRGKRKIAYRRPPKEEIDDDY